MTEIEVVIDKEGKVSIDLFGFNGKGCTEISDQLSKALGTRVERKKKGEYYKLEHKQKQKVRRQV